MKMSYIILHFAGEHRARALKHVLQERGLPPKGVQVPCQILMWLDPKKDTSYHMVSSSLNRFSKILIVLILLIITYKLTLLHLSDLIGGPS
jgi:hypothetical protein